MSHYLNLFLGIILLRKTPQDIPSSPVLFCLLIFLYVTIGLLNVASIFSLQENLVFAAFNLTLFLIFLYIVLSVYRFLPRFMQTATAMLGVGCLFRLLELPADVMLSNEQLTNTDPQVVFASLVLFFLLIYSTFVSGYILKHALSCSMLIGVSWALGYVVVNIILVSLLFFR